MGSGSYDRVITVQRASLADDGMESRPGAWANHAADVPARFVPGVGSERFANAENAATAPALFYFRWEPDFWPILETDSLLDDGERFHITSVRWDGRSTSEVEIAATRRGLAVGV